MILKFLFRLSYCIGYMGSDILLQEYSLVVQFGPLPETSWRVTKRYSDFSALDIVLKNAGFDLSLPPKKVFGKMESDFVEKRQQGLQVSLLS